MGRVIPTLHPNCAAVNKILQAAGLPGRVRMLDQAVTTARAAAEQLGCPVGAIANSLIFEAFPAASVETPERLEDSALGAPLLIMTSGAHRVDMNKVGGRLDSSSVVPHRRLSGNTPASRSGVLLQLVTHSPSAPSSIARSMTSTSFGRPAASRTP